MAPSIGGFVLIHNFSSFSFLFFASFSCLFCVCVYTCMCVVFTVLMDQVSAVPHAGSLQPSAIFCSVVHGSAIGVMI